MPDYTEKFTNPINGKIETFTLSRPFTDVDRQNAFAAMRSSTPEVKGPSIASMAGAAAGRMQVAAPPKPAGPHLETGLERDTRLGVKDPGYYQRKQAERVATAKANPEIGRNRKAVHAANIASEEGGPGWLNTMIQDAATGALTTGAEGIDFARRAIPSAAKLMGQKIIGDVNKTAQVANKITSLVSLPPELIEKTSKSLFPLEDAQSLIKRATLRSFLSNLNPNAVPGFVEQLTSSEKGMGAGAVGGGMLDTLRKAFVEGDPDAIGEIQGMILAGHVGAKVGAKVTGRAKAGMPVEGAPDRVTLPVERLPKREPVKVGYEIPETKPPPERAASTTHPQGGTKAALSVDKPKSGRTMYRQASPEEFLSGGYREPGAHYTDNPDLALGQGKNKGGILYEVEFQDGTTFTENMKPGTQVPGVGKEYVVGGMHKTHAGRALAKVKSLTVPKGTELPPDVKLNLETFSKEGGKNQVYTKEVLPDGSVKYTRIEKVATKPAAAPKVNPTPDAQGISHAHVDALREEIGWKPRTKTAKPDAQLFEGAKTYQGKEAGLTEKILGDSKATLADEESLALGQKLRSLKSEMQAAKKSGNGDVYDLADMEAQRIADALDTSGTRQGQAFRARQFLAKDELDGWTFARNVKKANLGEQVTGKKATQMQQRIGDLESTNATLLKEAEDARKQYELLLDATKSKRSKGPLTPTEKRNSALTSLRKLGVPVTEDFTNTGPVTGGAGSKEAGAIFMPGGVTEDIAKHVRSLVKSYADEGATMWIDKKGLGRGVMERLQRDLPGIEEGEALFILSGKYKKAALDANVARMKANAFMRSIKEDAQWRTKNWLQKSGKVFSDVLNTASRSLQTTADDSLALIQMKNVLMFRPGTWFKGVGKSLQAGFRTNPIEYARRHKANIEMNPLYAKAVKAKLALSDVDGSFSKQEELFAGTLENKVPVLANSKAAATVIGNEIRFDLFRKMAANAPRGVPDDVLAAYYEDIARTINVATGKGDGALATWLSAKPAGMVAYAPRMYLSRWQHNFMQPLWKAKTGAGRVEAAKMYASQALAYATLAYTAKEFYGMDVDLDPRSATFGRIWSEKGDWSFDLFGNSSEGLKTAVQFFFGRTSKGGNYTDPGDFGSFGPGSYIESKMAPGMKTLNMLRTGQVYDDNTGEFRDATGADFWKQYTPLSLQDMAKISDKPALMPFQFFGAGIEAKRRKQGNAPPLQWPPPGLKRILGAN